MTIRPSVSTPKALTSLVPTSTRTVSPSGIVTTPSCSIAAPSLGAGEGATGGSVRFRAPAAPEPDRDGDREYDGRDCGGCGPAPAADPARPAADVIEADRVATDPVRLVVQGPSQLFLGVHRSSSRPPGFRSCGARSRRVASARLAWDFTVPTEMPSASAVSASDRSS